MKITTIEFNSFSASGFDLDYEGQLHIKSLPCLSVVQAVEGSYDIALDGGDEINTGEGGIFIAPAEVMQRITHHNGKNGKMVARWAFLDVRINKQYALDDIFEFPLLMPSHLCERAGELISAIKNPASLCEKYAAAYMLTGMLIDIATPRSKPDTTLMLIRSFVSENFADDIGADDIAAHIHCSASQVFRYTRKYFSMSPANYINSVRLRRAAELLERTDSDIGSIADACGFEDHAYFSRLFRKTFNMTPGNYRRMNAQITTSTETRDKIPT